jgi:hypothetical protein
MARERELIISASLVQFTNSVNHGGIAIARHCYYRPKRGNDLLTVVACNLQDYV